MYKGTRGVYLGTITCRYQVEPLKKKKQHRPISEIILRFIRSLVFIFHLVSRVTGGIRIDPRTYRFRSDGIFSKIPFNRRSYNSFLPALRARDYFRGTHAGRKTRDDNDDGNVNTPVVATRTRRGQQVDNTHCSTRRETDVRRDCVYVPGAVPCTAYKVYARNGCRWGRPGR